MNKLFKFIVLSAIIIIFQACGKATVETQNESYEKRLVIEGFLIANQNVDRIFITRNFTVDSDLNKTSLIPDPKDTEVLITDLESGDIYKLSFYLEKKPFITMAYWHYEGDDLIIQAGREYQIDVSSRVNGDALTASARTRVPETGFAIKSINHQQLTYRERNDAGELINFEISYYRSPGTDYYMAAVQAQNPDVANFIYNNPYGDKSPQDVNLVDDAFNYEVAHHTPVSNGESSIKIGWHNFLFYDDYMIILYAADENYKKFFITYRQVMELDGNFHEAKYNIEGDGIGVFGSMIADTVTCKVKRR